MSSRVGQEAGTPQARSPARADLDANAGPDERTLTRVEGRRFPVFTGLGASCTDLDTSRTTPTRGSLGEELLGVMCDRIGVRSLHADLTGAFYAGISHRLPDGTFAGQVDTSQLPPRSTEPPTSTARVAPVETMGKHRDNLIAALDGECFF